MDETWDLGRAEVVPSKFDLEAEEENTAFVFEGWGTVFIFLLLFLVEMGSEASLGCFFITATAGILPATGVSKRSGPLFRALTE